MHNKQKYIFFLIIMHIICIIINIIHIFIHHKLQLVLCFVLQKILLKFSQEEVNMKKITAILTFFCVILSLSASAAGETPDNCVDKISVHTETTAYNWYCKKTADHSQPQLDSMLYLPDDCNAYFIDSDNSDYSSDEKVIYLTFDAGYENGNVEKILDILKEHDVPAAFFVLENLIKRNPELIKRMDSEGHLVCNHTATHGDMSKVTSKEQFAAELEKLNTVCKETTDVEVAKYYRPPEGRYSELNLRHASELGYKTIFWSFAYADWDNNSQMSADEAAKKVLDGTHNGEVLLLHPTSATNAAILDRLIKAWKADGFRFGTLDELTN